MTVLEYKKSVTFPNNLEITKAVQKYFKAPEGNQFTFKVEIQSPNVPVHAPVHIVQNFDQMDDFYFYLINLIIMPISSNCKFSLFI